MAKHGAAKGPESDPAWAITVLSVSPAEDDHLLLSDIFIHAKWVQESKFNWQVTTVLTIEAAMSALQEKNISIVLCESELLSGTWRDLMERISAHPDPPFMIVTSRLADEYLWVEALNHGVYDVLMKPFDTEELSRVLTMASFQWKHRRDGR